VNELVSERGPVGVGTASSLETMAPDSGDGQAQMWRYPQIGAHLGSRGQAPGLTSSC